MNIIINNTLYELNRAIFYTFFNSCFVYIDFNAIFTV